MFLNGIRRMLQKKEERIIKGRANVHAQMRCARPFAREQVRRCCVVLCCLNQMISPVASTTV